MPNYLTWEKQRNRYVFQIRIPKNLRAHFDNRTTVRQHIGNVPKEEAQARTDQLVAEYKAAFARCEQQQSVEVQ